MERHFEKDLNELKERLLWMGSLGERAVHHSVHSVLDSDEQLAKRVLDEEDAINELQIENRRPRGPTPGSPSTDGHGPPLRPGRLPHQQRSRAHRRPSL